MELMKMQINVVKSKRVHVHHQCTGHQLVPVTISDIHHGVQEVHHISDFYHQHIQMVIRKFNYFTIYNFNQTN